MARWLGKAVLWPAAAVLAAIAFTRPAAAVNPDTIVVSVTPSVTYSVSIASPMVQGYQFGTVALGATTISTVAIVLTNNGNISEYFSLAISNTSPDGWTTGGPGANSFRMRAWLSATQPPSASFADTLTNAVPGAAATLYNQASTKTNPSSTKNLWLRLEMPTSLTTGSGGAQTMTLTVNGQSS